MYFGMLDTEFSIFRRMFLRELNSILECCLELNSKFNDNFLNSEIKSLSLIIDDIFIHYKKIDEKEIKNILSAISNKVFNSKISSFKQALYQVKLIEHSIDKDKYPFTLDDLDYAVILIFMKDYFKKNI